MKTLMLVVAILALALSFGCAKKGDVDTAKLEASFSTAEPSAKSEMDKAVAAVKQQDWAGATASLQKLAADAKLTEAQKQAVKDTLEQVGNVIKETANKVTGEANKALGEAQKSLGN